MLGYVRSSYASIGRTTGVRRARRPFSPAGCLVIRCNLTLATAVIGEKRRSANYWRPARAGCPPIDPRAVRCSLAPMGLPLLWGPQGQRAGLGTRGLGVLYTGYGNKVKVGRYQSSRMPFGFFFFKFGLFQFSRLALGLSLHRILSSTVSGDVRLSTGHFFGTRPTK